MKLKSNWLYFFVFLLILAANSFFYGGCLDNYFFSDDFHWLGRAVLAQDSPLEIAAIEGRDFNPVFLFLLWLTVKIFGLSPVIFRILGLLVFSAVTWMFFYLLTRYFKVHILIAFSAALLSGFSVFVSEVVLNLSALVYSLSFLFFLAALIFYFNRPCSSVEAKEENRLHEETASPNIPNSPNSPNSSNSKQPTGRTLLAEVRDVFSQKRFYLVFLALAFLTKETIILAVIPLVFYEKEKTPRIFLVVSGAVLVLLRALLQGVSASAAASSYTDFLATDHIFYKLYFIIARSMNLSPYSLALPVGVLVIVLLFAVTIYFIKKNRGFLFFLLLLAVFSAFFALLPKLTSRYFFYPAFGTWGIAALLSQYFYEQKKYLKYALVPMLLISLLFNYPLVRREIEDYKILGNFSQQFIREQETFIKKQYDGNKDSPGITLFNRGQPALAGVYRQIAARNNLPKLLPFRQNSLAGVIEPRFLVPLIFYPGTVARWILIEETPAYFKGKIID